LQAEAICPINDVFGHSYDRHHPQKNQEDSYDIYPEKNAAGSEQGR